MNTRNRNNDDARRVLAARAEDWADLWRRIDGADARLRHRWIQTDDDDREAAETEAYEYPLSLEWSRGRVRLIFGTGGPHDELSWKRSGGRVDDPRFVFMPWFDRVELFDIPEPLRRCAEWFNDTIDGVAHLPGWDDDDPHNLGELVCDECEVEFDAEGNPQCDCG